MLESRPNLRRLAVAGAAAVLVATAAAGAQADPATPGPTKPGPTALVSPNVEWPSSDQVFPPGPGLKVVTDNCMGCHSPGMILNQPTLSPSTWNTEVHKMISVYKAPVSEADAKVIVDYLVAIKGPAACGGTGAAMVQVPRDRGDAQQTVHCP